MEGGIARGVTYWVTDRGQWGDGRSAYCAIKLVVAPYPSTSLVLDRLRAEAIEKGVTMFKPNSPMLLSLCLAVAACENDVTRELTAPEVELGTVDDAAALANSWATKSPVPAMRNFAVAGALNNVIYFVGGRDPGGQSTKTVLAYTVANNTWSVKPDLPKNRRAANGATSLGGRLYVSGGIPNTAGASKTLFAYSFSSNTWTQLKNMPTASACGAQGAIAGRLYVYAPAGGACGTQHRFYRYNPNNDSWTSLPKPPSIHLSPVAGVIGGKFYLAGGTKDGALTPNLALHVYDPATNSWATKASLPTKQQNATGGAQLGKLYVVGGINFTAPGVPPIATVRAYNPANNTWTPRAGMLTPRFYAASASAFGLVWVIGGSGAGGPSTKLEAYTP
jgi:N-acetylneuraminic acid mutarotase